VVKTGGRKIYIENNNSVIVVEILGKFVVNTLNFGKIIFAVKENSCSLEV